MAWTFSLDNVAVFYFQYFETCTVMITKVYKTKLDLMACITFCAFLKNHISS